MITQRDLVQRLARRNLAGWSVLERVQDIATVDERRALQRREHRTRLTLIVHHDVPRGRGSARLDVDNHDGSADDLIDQAIALALAAVGPDWFSAPPAAPARVNLVDDGLVRRELDDAARNLLVAMRRPPGVAVTASCQILRETLTVIASSGFHFTWPATAIRVDALVTLPPSPQITSPDQPTPDSRRIPRSDLPDSDTHKASGPNQPASDHQRIISPTQPASDDLRIISPTQPASDDLRIISPTQPASDKNRIVSPVQPASDDYRTTGSDPSIASPASPIGDRSFAIIRQARRVDDLGLDAALAGAAIDLGLLAHAGSPVPGPCALWLRSDALLHGGDLGLWSIFAHLADSAIERQGLSRFRLHAELAPGAPQLAEPLAIASDGALDFALDSAPIADDAVAVRRFPLVERGIATGLGLSAREAALRHTDPNGGVRNLVVAPGTWPASPSPAVRTIEIRRLHALTIDPHTGDASLDIALGLDHRPDRPDPTPFTSGTIHLDLLTALARARRSSQLLRRGAYHGPDSLLVEDAQLLA